MSCKIRNEWNEKSGGIEYQEHGVFHPQIRNLNRIVARVDFCNKLCYIVANSYHQDKKACKSMRASCTVMFYCGSKESKCKMYTCGADECSIGRGCPLVEVQSNTERHNTIMILVPPCPIPHSRSLPLIYFPIFISPSQGPCHQQIHLHAYQWLRVELRKWSTCM